MLLSGRQECDCGCYKWIPCQSGQAQTQSIATANKLLPPHVARFIRPFQHRPLEFLNTGVRSFERARTATGCQLWTRPFRSVHRGRATQAPQCVCQYAYVRMLPSIATVALEHAVTVHADISVRIGLACRKTSRAIYSRQIYAHVHCNTSGAHMRDSPQFDARAPAATCDI